MDKHTKRHSLDDMKASVANFNEQGILREGQRKKQKKMLQKEPLNERNDNEDSLRPFGSGSNSVGCV